MSALCTFCGGLNCGGFDPDPEMQRLDDAHHRANLRTLWEQADQLTRPQFDRLVEEMVAQMRRDGIAAGESVLAEECAA